MTGDKGPQHEHDHPHSIYEAGEFLDAPPDEQLSEREVSLRERLLNWRTLASFAFSLVLLYLLFQFFFGEEGFDFALMWQQILQANVWLLLLAFVSYYLTFPVRGLRWAFILRRVGTPIRYRDATEILFLSWFVNCLVPAKLGDLYRAWLLKGNYGASISRSVGTVFIERVADIVVIFGLALAAGWWSLRGRSRPELETIFLIGFVLAAVLVIGIVGLRFFGAKVTRWLPIRMAEFYERFREGSTGALSVRSVPVILLLTGVIWMLEGMRLLLVIRALDLPGVNIGISASIFVALMASLLTAVPLTPAGLGFVEAGIVGALSIYRVVREPAVAVALMDRAISILTVIIIGGIAWTLSGKVRRAHGIGPSPGVVEGG